MCLYLNCFKFRTNDLSDLLPNNDWLLSKLFLKMYLFALSPIHRLDSRTLSQRRGRIWLNSFTVYTVATYQPSSHTHSRTCILSIWKVYEWNAMHCIWLYAFLWHCEMQNCPLLELIVWETEIIWNCLSLFWDESPAARDDDDDDDDGASEIGTK